MDALTDHWYIGTEAWLDVGRDGDRTTALKGILGHYVGQNDLIFGEAWLYPGPMDWNLYAGWLHRFGREYQLGYKYDLVDNSSHVTAVKQFGDRWAVRYERDFRKKRMNMGFLTGFIII